jgi:predicted RNase H-like HicB family nuclease
MFNASYPASFLPEGNGKRFHVPFPDLPEALTGGDDLEDTLAQATDCLAEAIAGRIARGDEIPQPSRAKRSQHLIGVPLYLARNSRPPYVEPEAQYQPEKIQAALAAMGKRIAVTFEDAAR